VKNKAEPARLIEHASSAAQDRVGAIREPPKAGLPPAPSLPEEEKVKVEAAQASFLLDLSGHAALYFTPHGHTLLGGH
jgi:hypothetical protein